ncbi:MAG: hypothetical protein HOP15_15230 [Planctomycetes bacterium]|nr:hypothetical protein [Planctomycetota bacterium]
MEWSNSWSMTSAARESGMVGPGRVGRGRRRPRIDADRVTIVIAALVGADTDVHFYDTHARSADFVFASLAEDVPHFIELQCLPEDLGQKTHEDVRLYSIFAVVPDRAYPEFALLHAKRRLGVGQHERAGSGLPDFVRRELYAYLDCGILANGFARVHCASCGRVELVAFSCKGHGFSCCGRRMAESAMHLADQVLPAVPIRQGPGSDELVPQPRAAARQPG